MKLLLIFALFCSMLFVLYLNKDMGKTYSMLALVDIESLAFGESGTVTDCRTEVEYDLEYQKCNINGRELDMPSRGVTKYKCEGKGEGSCWKGTHYVYYDCYGDRVSTNDFVNEASCK